ncbi:MAG: AbrB/MazE/SpoVT family DNA-binding domain-containing protein [Clostridia bacterium]|nr:AbrB/MazE/SpoVT family DNA-binding domain-containing protein [Clostridia bacterium]
MKATGIVRRIDDLGRVVIPKEIRRTMRIREGDPLEIYTDTDGEVIFKKYSPIGELGPYTKQYVDVLNRTSGLAVIICDRDHVIAVSGMPKKEIMGKRISPMVESYMERRASFVYGTDRDELVVSEEMPVKIAVMSPIIGGGDVMGAVMLLCGEKATAPGQTDIKLTQVAAGFLGKQMEE